MSLWYVWHKLCTYLVLTQTPSPNAPKRDIPLEPRHLGVPSGASKMISESMVHVAQTQHLSCTDTNTISKRTENKLPLEPCHLGVPSSVSKIISEPMVCSAQTMHLSCVNIRTISKWTETSIHLSARSSIGCVQNDFQAYGTVNLNHATVLCQD